MKEGLIILIDEQIAFKLIIKNYVDFYFMIQNCDYDDDDLIISYNFIIVNINFP